eukprot:1160172-Pelagomonas_calceolata.AAC.7
MHPSAAGGGAVEAALSVYLESFATTLGSREQLAIGEFANASLVIPKTLAVNAAKDATAIDASMTKAGLKGDDQDELRIKQSTMKPLNLWMQAAAHLGKEIDEQGTLTPCCSAMSGLQARACNLLVPVCCMPLICEVLNAVCAGAGGWVTRVPLQGTDVS